MNALRDQAKSKVVETGLPVLKNMRLAPDVFETLRAEMGDSETWAEFATRGMIALAAMRRIVRDNLSGVNPLVVRIVGGLPYDPTPLPTDVGTPYERRKPLANASARKNGHA